MGFPLFQIISDSIYLFYFTEEEIKSLKETNGRLRTQIPAFQNEIKALKNQLQELTAKRTTTEKAVAGLAQVLI